jgi:uncharacterized membrane protein
MSIAHFAPMRTARDGSRWLLLGSLAANLFFIGVALAMIIRAPAPSYWDRDVFVRVERLATTLPAQDAALLRGEINANRKALEAAQTQYRAAQDEIRLTLRQNPFETEAMRVVMSRTRAARQNFDQILQGVFLTAASKMSSAGRNAVADWPPGRKTSGVK